VRSGRQQEISKSVRYAPPDLSFRRDTGSRARETLGGADSFGLIQDQIEGPAEGG
jgi:hypothetical protein